MNTEVGMFHEQRSRESSCTYLEVTNYNEY